MEVDQLLHQINLPAGEDLPLEEFIDTICGVLDIPLYRSGIGSITDLSDRVLTLRCCDQGCLFTSGGGGELTGELFKILNLTINSK